jgi:exopolysaccharide biosynthesis WecB/TagA/CpsF family protein
MNKTMILNVEIDNVSQNELLAQLKRGVLVTPNVDQIVKMQTDREYYDIVRRTEWCVCDSRILYLCSKFAKQPLKATIPGSSFFPAFYEYHRNDENCKIFLLGAMDGVAQKAMERINGSMGRRMVVGAYSPSYGFEKKQDENEEIYKMINDSGANVVLVGVGCPKQEKWIDKHKAMMPGVDIWMALGATIDFEAGNIKRAPKIWQKLCLEWFYRFIQEPKRMYKRYFFDDPIFFWYFLKQLMGTYKNPFEPSGDCNRL